MPELPDLDQIAQRIVKLRADLEDEEMRDQIAEQLLQVWNARGAADLDAIDSALAYTKDGLVAGARHQIANAIRTLDAYRIG